MVHARSRPDRLQSDLGFTIVEVLFALALIAIAAAGVANLCGIAIRATHDARDETMATMIAAQKIEQLRSAPWGSGDLSLSPPDTLSTNTSGYADFLDRRGRSVGTGVAPPLDGVYTRRWNVALLPSGGPFARVLRVLVSTTARVAGVRAGGSRARQATEALVVAVRSGG